MRGAVGLLVADWRSEGLGAWRESLIPALSPKHRAIFRLGFASAGFKDHKLEFWATLEFCRNCGEPKGQNSRVD